MNEIKALEHPTLKVPYEVFNKKYRGAQKVLDFEARQLASVVNEIDSATKKGEVMVQDIDNLLGGMEEKLNTMKRKASEAISSELQAADTCKKRLQHISEHAAALEEPDSTEMKAVILQWRKTRLDRMLVDYCLRYGYYETANKLADTLGIRELTNCDWLNLYNIIDIYAAAAEVEAELSQQRTSRCLTWCADNKSKLRKINSNMEFKIRIQEFIELVRADKRIEAVRYAKKYLSNYEEGQLPEIQQCMGMLAFPTDTDVEPYRSLLSCRRRAALVTQFRSEHGRLLHPAPVPLLAATLQLGTQALNTPQCYNPATRSAACPACQPPLNTLARSLPLAHCTHSRLICRISRTRMDEHNQPMALPNGQVYGEKALNEMMKEHGAIICPKTKEVFCMKRVEKVYVM